MNNRKGGRQINLGPPYTGLPDEPYQKTCPQYPEGGGWEKVWFKEESTADGWDKRINRYGEPSGFGTKLAWVYPFIPAIRCTHGVTKQAAHDPADKQAQEDLAGVNEDVKRL